MQSKIEATALQNGGPRLLAKRHLLLLWLGLSSILGNIPDCSSLKNRKTKHEARFNYVCVQEFRLKQHSSQSWPVLSVHLLSLFLKLLSCASLVSRQH